MPDAAADLFGEKIKQRSRGLSHGVFQIDRINFTPAEIPREQDLSQAVKDINNAFFGWNRFVISQQCLRQSRVNGL
jgi:hypothetical protein